MKGIIVSFRRGRHTYKPRHYLLQFDGVVGKPEAEKLVGKRVMWESPSGKKISGEVKGVHGGKGLVRAVFEKGLPGQAVTTEIEVL